MTATVEHTLKVEKLRYLADSFDSSISPDIDTKTALACANDLLGIAQLTVTIAAEHAQENPEDYELAKQAAQQAQAMVNELSLVRHSTDRRQQPRDLSQRLSNLASTVINVAHGVVEHEGGSSSDSARRQAHYAALEHDKHQAKRKATARTATPIIAPRRRNRHGNDDNNDDHPIIAPLPAAAARGNGRAGANIIQNAAAQGATASAAAGGTASIISTAAPQMAAAQAMANAVAHANIIGDLPIPMFYADPNTNDQGGGIARIFGNAAAIGARAVNPVFSTLVNPITTGMSMVSFFTGNNEPPPLTFDEQLRGLLPFVRGTNWHLLVSANGQHTFDHNGRDGIDLNELKNTLARHHITDARQVGDHNEILTTQELITIARTIQRAERARLT